MQGIQISTRYVIILYLPSIIDYNYRFLIVDAFDLQLSWAEWLVAAGFSLFTFQSTA